MVYVFDISGLSIFLQLAIIVPLVIILILVAMFPLKKYFENPKNKFWVFLTIIELFIIIILGLFVIKSSYSPFLYFRFLIAFSVLIVSVWEIYIVLNFFFPSNKIVQLINK